jgi:hypothetical protein
MTTSEFAPDELQPAREAQRAFRDGAASSTA